MSDTLITIILGCNIILLFLYFAVKFHRQSSDKNRELHNPPHEEAKKDPAGNDN